MIEALASLCAPMGLWAFVTFTSLRRRIDLWDEAYLVYGTQALRRGEVPIRDFRAYDPGRYYWFALWSFAFGPGFVAVRAALATLAAVGVSLVVLVVLDATDRSVLAAGAGCISALWMLPRDKQMEIFFCIFTTSVNYAAIVGYLDLISLGFIASITLIFGLNFAIYSAGSAVLLFLTLTVQKGFNVLVDAMMFASGFLGGCLLIFAITSMVPGFARAYLDKKVLALLRRGTTNLPRAKPWIWSRSEDHFPGVAEPQKIAFQTIFTFSAPLFAMFAFMTAVSPVEGQGNASGLIIASACTGIAYYHYAISRADLVHLAPVIQPLIFLFAAIGSAYFSPAFSALMMVALIGATIALLWGSKDFVAAWNIGNPPLRKYTTATDQLMLDAGTADKFIEIERIVDANCSENDSLFVAPIPGFLAVFNRRSAVYDTYPVYPANHDSQESLLAELVTAAPPVVVLTRAKTDNRDDLLFSNNYPKVFNYINNNYKLEIDSSIYMVFAKFNAK